LISKYFTEEEKTVTYQTSFWQKRAFPLVMYGCILFVVLTLVAMLFYHGGTSTDPTKSNYSFFTNFLSALGLTETYDGEPNTVSAILFILAMTLAGGGLVVFSLAFPQFFTSSLSGKLIIGIGSLFGVVSGICFIGVGFTPANLFIEAHGRFVLLAFQAFPVAMVFYVAAILRESRYPNRHAVVFVVFAALLVFYLVLMTRGPGPDTPDGLMIQATGQKVIAYASVISIYLQARAAKDVLESTEA
jgi:hypothetical protein